MRDRLARASESGYTTVPHLFRDDTFKRRWRGMQADATMRFGVAGWSYPDWRDTVYRLPHPTSESLFADLPRPDHKARYPSDQLAYLAEFVDMIEVNSSFYRIPDPGTVAGWARRVESRSGFVFTAKLNQAFTHAGSTRQAEARQFEDAFTPLREAGLLRALLAQFRYDVADSATARTQVAWIADRFRALAPIVVEVRHRSWQGDDALSFLESLDE